MSRIKIEDEIKPVATKEEYFEVVDDIATLDVERQKLEVELKARHQEIDNLFGEKLDALKKEIQCKMRRAQPYFIDHKDELCAKGQKQGETKLAIFGIRTGMPKFVKKVRTALKALAEEWFERKELKPFIRTARDIDQAAVIALWKEDREKFNAVIPKSQVTVTQEDTFWVEPKADDQV